MNGPRLLINGEREFEPDGTLISIGRASDNTIAFPEDSNVSRYHAEIERRGENELWIFDLNSSNGTTLNGERVTAEKPLFDGDTIVLGGTSTIEIALTPAAGDEEEKEDEKKEDGAEQAESNAAGAGGAAGAEAAVAEPEKPKISLLIILAGLVLGLAFISVMAAGVFYLTRDGGLGGSGCQARARITSPRNGEILKKPAEIEIALENGDCVRRVEFLMDGKPFAEARSQPYTATLDPAEFPVLAADGLDHNLSLVLYDEEGTPLKQPGEIALALETIRTKKDDEEENGEPGGPGNGDGGNGQTGNGNGPPVGTETQMSLIDVQKMTGNVLPQFAGKFEYQTGNQSFLEAVRKMTAEYASEGYFERARRYNDVIAKEFIQNRDLDPPLGYLLAMSRTKFEPTNMADGAGLWRMDNDLVLENAYNGSCGAETIAGPTQKCAAIASSIYIKDIIRDVFEGDIIYGIAAFGMSKNEAAAWKATLPPPAQRKDFWNVIRSPQQREEIVRFFAAATVAENPQKFGLENDRPLSDLYRSYME